jgi:hypothetical protein
MQLLIPILPYHHLLHSCDPKAPEREFLSNGVIEQDSAGQQRVRIFCDVERAARIYRFITRVRPEVLAFITQIIFME